MIKCIQCGKEFEPPAQGIIQCKDCTHYGMALYQYIDKIKEIKSNVKTFIDRMQYQMDLKDKYKVYNEQSFDKIKEIFDEFKEKIK